MAGSKRVLVLHNASLNPSRVRCVIKHCKTPLPEDLAGLLASGEVSAFGNWSYAQPPGCAVPAPNPLTVLHAIAGDAGPDIRLLPDADDPGAAEAFSQWHQADAATGRCTVVRFPTRDMELVLVPVLTKTGAKGTPGPTYWGFTVTANLLPLMASTLHSAKLLAVFDIDETLLMAHTVDSLSTRLERIQTAREAKAAELRAAESAGDADTVAQLKPVILALKTEQALLKKDFEMLSSFRQDAACRVVCDGQVFEPRWECSTTACGAAVTRPVVRLELAGRPVIFTRIMPESKSTSMLIRPRPGWDALRVYLAGQDALKADGTKKTRWDVYLCTTADREYAWEAWRLLDPQASVFSLDQLAWRMLCVAHPQKKDLLNVLRKGQVDAAAARGEVPRCASDPQLVTDKARASRPPVGSPAPLCVVVDDRLDVWEEDSRKAVLQVMPFHPHKEAAALDLGASRSPPAAYQQALDSEGELPRVAATLRDIRSATYQTLDKSVKPEVERLTSTGVTDRLQDSAASILASLLVPLKSVPQLLAESAHRPPAALGSTEKDDRASDLRLLVHDGTMEAADAALAAAAATAGGGGERGLPKRKREGSDGEAEAAAAAAAAAGAGAGGAAAGDACKQQQQHGKKRKKEKHRLFEGVDLAGIVSAIGNEQQQQQQQQQEPPLKLGSDEESQQQSDKHRLFGKVDLAGIMAALGNQQQQQQQPEPPEGNGAAQPDPLSSRQAAAMRRKMNRLGPAGLVGGAGGWGFNPQQQQQQQAGYSRVEDGGQQQQQQVGGHFLRHPPGLQVVPGPVLSGPGSSTMGQVPPGLGPGGFMSQQQQPGAFFGPGGSMHDMQQGPGAQQQDLAGSMAGNHPQQQFGAVPHMGVSVGNPSVGMQGGVGGPGGMEMQGMFMDVQAPMNTQGLLNMGVGTGAAVGVQGQQQAGRMQPQGNKPQRRQQQHQQHQQHQQGMQGAQNIHDPEMQFAGLQQGSLQAGQQQWQQQQQEHLSPKQKKLKKRQQWWLQQQQQMGAAGWEAAHGQPGMRPGQGFAQQQHHQLQQQQRQGHLQHHGQQQQPRGRPKQQHQQGRPNQPPPPPPRQQQPGGGQLQQLLEQLHHEQQQQQQAGPGPRPGGPGRGRGGGQHRGQHAKKRARGRAGGQQQQQQQQHQQQQQQHQQQPHPPLVGQHMFQ